MCLGGVLAGMLIAGCTTTPAMDIAVSVREPDKWNEERAFKVINERDVAIKERIKADSSFRYKVNDLVGENYAALRNLRRGGNQWEKYQKMNDAPLFSSDGMLYLDVTFAQDSLSGMRGTLQKKRIPLSAISHVEVEKTRTHLWPWYWWPAPPILIFTPAYDGYVLNVHGNEKEKPLVSWEFSEFSPTFNNRNIWCYFPFWMARPLHFVNNPKRQAEVQELVEAFEWLRLNK